MIKELKYPIEIEFNKNTSAMIENFRAFKYTYDKGFLKDQMMGRRRTINECVEILLLFQRKELRLPEHYKVFADVVNYHEDQVELVNNLSIESVDFKEWLKKEFVQSIIFIAQNKNI